MPDSLSEAQITAVSSQNPEYLFVDMDGTLVRTDVFVEAILKLIKKNPLNIFKLLLWGLKGRAVLKSRVARASKIDPHFLPYEEAMVSYIKEQKALGRKIILATASHWTYAKRVADHLGLFDDVIGSSAKKISKAAASFRRSRTGLAAHRSPMPAIAPLIAPSGMPPRLPSTSMRGKPMSGQRKREMPAKKLSLRGNRYSAHS